MFVTFFLGIRDIPGTSLFLLQVAKNGHLRHFEILLVAALKGSNYRGGPALKCMFLKAFWTAKNARKCDLANIQMHLKFMFATRPSKTRYQASVLCNPGAPKKSEWILMMPLMVIDRTEPPTTTTLLHLT